MESLLAAELRALGAATRETRAGVAFDGGLTVAYRACLWSRLASRILLPLARFRASSPKDLYDGARTVPWNEHISADGTLAVDANVSQSVITHSHYAALKVKDAIVDQLREQQGRRPSVDTERPDMRVNLHLRDNEATISLDLAGDSLHQRGYRDVAGEAPLKENLAAAMLLRADWPTLAQSGAPFVDLMCGSGTLPIEAALMAGDVAPGLLRPHHGFLRWRAHDATAWSALLVEANERRQAGLARLPAIRGYDGDRRAIDNARKNAVRAQLGAHVSFEVRALGDGEPDTTGPGLVVANPPYGERMGDPKELSALYASLGETLKRKYDGWRAAVLTGNAELGHAIGLRAQRLHKLYNGAIECTLLHFEVSAASHRRRPASLTSAAELGSSAEMFANRLRKNLRHFGRWASRQGIDAYRLYDADLHEYNLAIDVYECNPRFVHVQEYQAPASVDARDAARRLRHALAVIALELDVPAERIHLKVRQKQKQRRQYEKLSQRGEFHTVREGRCKFLVNLTDYLDTGLFLDHRPTRALIGELAAGRRFLNLYAYTGTATVHAALGGARASTSVDMSRTYLDWAGRNFELNGVDPKRHELVRADVGPWLDANRRERFDLIFLDPPTFSRSKRMQGALDIERDHVELIEKVVRLLAPGGTLIFSTNYQRFKLDRAALADLSIEDITRRTLPKDFERNPRIHQCFRITRPRE